MSYMRSPVYVIGSRNGIEFMFHYNGLFADKQYGYVADNYCFLPYDIFEDVMIGHLKRMSKEELQKALERYDAHNACYDEYDQTHQQVQEKIAKVFPREDC